MLLAGSFEAAVKMDGAKAYHLGISLGIAFVANADSVLRNHRVSSWRKKVGSLVSDFKLFWVKLFGVKLFSQVSYLGPAVGVKAWKRNEAASTALNHCFRGSAHCIRAAVAQVVLVVCELLLVSQYVGSGHISQC